MTIISAVIENPRVVVGTSQREWMQNMTILTLSIQHRESGLGKGLGERPTMQEKAESHKRIRSLRSSWRSVKWQTRVQNNVKEMEWWDLYRF